MLIAASSTGELTAAQAVHQIVQFVRVVRYRKQVVLLTLAAAGLLAGLYYATATRRYEAKASLLILQTGVEVTNTSMQSEDRTQMLMPTYERLITSAVVLEAALGYIGPEHRIDLEGLAQERWLDELRKNLTVSTTRRTNLIDVAYRSRSSETAVVVVNAVVRAYLEFMEKTHQGTAGEIIAVLTREKVQLEQRLAGKESEVLRLRSDFGDMGIRSGDKVVHPVVQRAVQLNEALIAAQKKRLELQASQATLEQSIARGEDLQQHVLAIEQIVGQQFLLNGLGIGEHDAAAKATIEQGFLEDQAELRSLQEYFGPAHPRVAELEEKLRLTREYLDGYQLKVNHRLAQMRDTQLGPLLMQMIQQRLSECWQHEQSLAHGFELARREAVGLNGKLAQLEICEHDLKWLRELRETLLNQIASVDLKQDQGDIRTAVVSEPVMSEKPVSPRLSLVAAIALVGGLMAGVVLVLALDALDDRFRSPDELRLQLGIPVLAMVRRLENLAPTGVASLQVHVAPQEVQSEAFRTLRTTLAFAGRETQRLVVSSAEPGDGKTTVLANLAVSYAQAGKRTLLIDADMRRPGLSNLLELRSLTGLSDVLRSEAPVAEVAGAALRQIGVPGLEVLPCGPRPSNPAELLGSTRFSDLLAWAETAYDQILVDGPPSLAASDSALIGRLVDGVVLVVRPDKNQRRLVVKAVESFSSLGVTMLGVVINRIASDKDEGYYGYNYGYGAGYGYGYNYEGDDAAAEHSRSDAASLSADPIRSPAAQSPARRVA
jgi:capsular exopolysaccharide synthesis family protein